MGVIMYKKQLYSGGSDVEPNPSEEATEVLSSIKIDDEVYEIEGGSGGNYFGSFIDTDNLIQDSTQMSSQSTYIASEDCAIVVVYSATTSAQGSIAVNDFVVLAVGGVNTTLRNVIYVKKGDVVTFNPVGTYNFYYVYGLKSGSESNFFQPVIYSEEEREIGVWIDSKPLYQKTFDLGSDISVSNTSWYNSIVIVTNIEKISSAWGMYSGGTYYPLMAYHTNDDVNVLAARANSGASVRYLTLQYTKTTDVPGSGQYTTLGVPAVHYSTDEQIIGTWIDGKPLYQKTVEANLSNGVIYTVTDGDMVLVHEAYGAYDVSGTIQYLNLNAYFTSSDNCMIYTSGSDIYSQVTNTFKTYYPKALLTIRYTKTTY